MSLAYDALGRLREVAGSSTTRFLYDGTDLIAEYDGSGAVLRRYVHGPGVDEPLVWYEGSGTSDRRWPIADERGSVVALTSDYAVVTAVNSYDAFGAPASGNVGRFGYTGQIWLPEAGLWHYKARAYHPGLGRFLQTDPIGVAGGLNLYGYAGNDPVNATDPSGLCFNGIWGFSGLFIGDTLIGGVIPLGLIACLDPVSPGLAWYGSNYPGADGGSAGGEGSSAGGSSGEAAPAFNLGDLNPLRCPVVEMEISYGLQGRAAGKLGIVEASAHGDLVSVRYSISTRGPNLVDFQDTYTQSIGASFTVGVPHSDIGVSHSVLVGRYSPASGPDTSQTISMEEPVPFLGIGADLALLIGGRAEIGYDFPGIGNPCPGE